MPSWMTAENAAPGSPQPKQRRHDPQVSDAADRQELRERPGPLPGRWLRQRSCGHLVARACAHVSGPRRSRSGPADRPTPPASRSARSPAAEPPSRTGTVSLGPRIVALMWAAALLSTRSCRHVPSGTMRPRASRISSHTFGSAFSLMTTAAVACGTYTRQSPFATPERRTTSPTCAVMSSISCVFRVRIVSSGMSVSTVITGPSQRAAL